eukprot:CCRYP_010793-RA/>CCRYP_010793-RA protein AED:0.04 eAED:0.04 QI:65/1/1/1/0.33/0/4/489/874
MPKMITVGVLVGGVESVFHVDHYILFHLSIGKHKSNKPNIVFQSRSVLAGGIAKDNQRQVCSKMRSSASISNSDQRKKKTDENLAKGVHDTIPKRGKTRPVGSLIIETTTVSCPSSAGSVDSSPVQKTTTIIRKDPNGEDCRETNTEEFTIPNSVNRSNHESWASDTQSYVLPDGAGVITTTNTSKLIGESLSTVDTEVHLNRIHGHRHRHGHGHRRRHGHDHNHSHERAENIQRRHMKSAPKPPSLHSVPINDAVVHPEQRAHNNAGTVDINILPSDQQSLTPLCHYDDKTLQPDGMEGKDVHSNKPFLNSPHPEIIPDDQVFNPPQYLTKRGIISKCFDHGAPNDPQGRGVNRAMKIEMGKSGNVSIHEKIDSTPNQPDPLIVIEPPQSNFITSNIAQLNSDEEIIPDVNMSEWYSNHNTKHFNKNKQHQKHNETNTPPSLVSSGQMIDLIDTNRRSLSRSNDEDNSIHVAEATPISIYEAELCDETEVYDARVVNESRECVSSSSPPFYKSKRCMAITLLFVLMFGVSLSISMVYGTDLPEEAISMASPPLGDASSGIQKMIERFILRRNATFNDMNGNDPRLLALDWISHKDTMQLDVGDEKLYPRYILALLAFQFDSLGVKTTARNGMWLTDSDECEWNGVSCVDGKVTGLGLSLTKLIGEIPPEISGLTFLERLELRENCLFGTIPPEIGSMSQLNYIDLALNRLSGIVPNALYDLTFLTHLNLGWQSSNYDFYNCTGILNKENHGLKGRILEEIGQMTNLKEIWLNENDFSGSISSDIGNLIELEIVSGDGNAFNGTIPDEISYLTKLRELSLATNSFSGPLPESIGELNVLGKNVAVPCFHEIRRYSSFLYHCTALFIFYYHHFMF